MVRCASARCAPSAPGGSGAARAAPRDPTARPSDRRSDATPPAGRPPPSGRRARTGYTARRRPPHRGRPPVCRRPGSPWLDRCAAAGSPHGAKPRPLRPGRRSRTILTRRPRPLPCGSDRRPGAFGTTRRNTAGRSPRAGWSCPARSHRSGTRTTDPPATPAAAVGDCGSGRAAGTLVLPAAPTVPRPSSTDLHRHDDVEVVAFRLGRQGNRLVGSREGERYLLGIDLAQRIEQVLEIDGQR